MRSENRTVTHRKNRLPIRPSAEERTWSVCTARSTASIKCPTVSKQNVSGTGGETIRMPPPPFPFPRHTRRCILNQFTPKAGTPCRFFFETLTFSFYVLIITKVSYDLTSVKRWTGRAHRDHGRHRLKCHLFPVPQQKRRTGTEQKKHLRIPHLIYPPISSGSRRSFGGIFL